MAGFGDRCVITETKIAT